MATHPRGRRTGKGATVRQERTSARGDPGGSVNPTRSKARQGEGGPSDKDPRVGRWSRRATAGREGWPPTPAPQGTWVTESGVQAGSPPSCP